MPQYSRSGTWADEIDIRPTLLHLVGLATTTARRPRHHPDAPPGPRVAAPDPGARYGYKQLNASVAAFGTDTLVADTAALASGSAGHDARFAAVEARLARLADQRERLATRIAQTLRLAELGKAPAAHVVAEQSRAAASLLAQARWLAARSH